MKKWIPLMILGAAQFVMVLDSSVMNVSISQIVADLDTTITGVQLAITAYTLVMAAFMLVGAKLGDIYGRDRIFAIGLAVYGLGSLTTALSPNLGVLLFGWSLVEGLGAVMVIPAIAALIVSNYEGQMRALAYGIIGGVAGAAIALGPLIGGWVTTTFSWRYVFAAETVVVVGILLVRKLMRSAQPSERRPQLDLFGAALSAAGLGLAVFGILKSSEWGWIQPRGAPEIGGTEITPFGLSVVLFLIVIGLCLLGAFWEWEEHRERRGKDTLVDRSLLKIVPLSAGLKTLVMQQLVLLGTFFVLPVYLQVVLGLDAFETGKRLFPMSITMLVAALAGPRLAARLAPKRVVQVGLGGLAIGAFCLMGTIDVKLNTLQFSLSLALFGLGIGLVISQLGNVIMSSVDESKTNEAGGLQGTAQNLGASLGTALIGSVLIAGLTSGFVSRIEDSSQLPQRAKTQIVAVAEQGLDVVPVSEVEEAAKQAGLRPGQAEEVADSYGAAELDGLQNALLAVALLCVVSFWFTRHLPGRAEVGERTEPAPEGMPDRLAAGT
ncbi:MAG TPA: MFS transporter [Gaiellaceae bacterium]|jgi:EmrB/QacA subfamily drug resistance transporter